MGNIQDAVNKYSSKSNSELMDELKGFKKSGMMDDAKLSEIAKKLAPMLNPQQLARLKTVMDDLKKD